MCIRDSRNIVNSVLERIGLGGLATFLDNAANRFKTFDAQVKTSNVTMELFGRQLGVVSTGVTTAEDNVALFGRQLGIVSEEAVTTSDALEDLGVATENTMSNAATSTNNVSDRIAALATRYGLTESSIRNTPLAIPIEPGKGPNDLSAMFTAMLTAFANAAKGMKDNNDIPEAMNENIRVSDLFRVSIQDLATAARGSASRIAYALEDISPALRPAADGLRAFVDDLSRGETFAVSVNSAIGAIKTGGLSLLIDSAIGVVTEMFAKDERARRIAEANRQAMIDNRRALEQNTETIIRSITGGMGGQQLVGMANLLMEFSRRIEASPGALPEGIYDFLYEGLAELGMSLQDFYKFAEGLGLTVVPGNVTWIMELGKRINELINNQLSGFAETLDALQREFEFRGTGTQSRIQQLISYIQTQTGSTLDTLLTRLYNLPGLDQIGANIADIVTGLRNGNRDLIASLGDIPINDFISALDTLFALFSQRASEMVPTPPTPPEPEAEPEPEMTVSEMFDRWTTVLAEQFKFLEFSATDQFRAIAQGLRGFGGELLRTLGATIKDFSGDPAFVGEQLLTFLQTVRNSTVTAEQALTGITIEQISRVFSQLFALSKQVQAEAIRAQEELDRASGASLVSDMSADGGMPVNMMFDPVLMAVGEAAVEERDATEVALEQDRIAYDAMINRLEMLDSRLNTLIGTNRTGFEDVAGAVLRR